ncbi:MULTISPECIES: TonB-dependent receptor [Sphingobacterium]|uniref:TonB-dependent receptor n=1 Tax=Sphingobacterium TaxID=28453 RepID=UPI0013D9BA83|nr:MULTISPECIES: TonB-dependent receptor [unclassified Sphingobacterium]
MQKTPKKQRLLQRCWYGTHLFLFMLCLNTGFAQQNQSLDLDYDQTSIIDILKAIERQTTYRFFYQREQLDIPKKVSIHVKNNSIQQVLDKLFPNESISYEIKPDGLIVLKPKTKATRSKESAQQRKVTGLVTDEMGTPLRGVSVKSEGASSGVSTDNNGRYEITVGTGNASLIFSYLGMENKTVSTARRSNIDVTLGNSAVGLSEVVVSVGYGAVNKKDLTGSISSLKDKDFNKGLVTNPVELMQGRAPGINIITNGGEPGAGAMVRVRGSNSVRSGQDPLYVVDGVPLDITDIQPSGATISGAGSNATKNPLNFLNPDDIASMDILKDASATAIYGSRGANGVIIITTKKGKSGKGILNISSNASISTLPKQLDVMSAETFKSYRTSKGISGGDYGASTNWQDQIYRPAYSQNHNLSYGGGNENGNYRGSLGFMDQEGIIRKTGLEKLTARFNISQNLINNRLKIEANITAARTKDRRVPIGETGGFEGDVILSALKNNPTLPIYHPDGSYYQLSKDVRNPLAMINLTNDNNQNDRILGNITASLDIIKGLKYKINLASDRSNASRKVTQHHSLIYLTNKGTVDISNVEQNSSLAENFLTYDFNVDNKHRFNLLAGHSYQQFKAQSYKLTEEGFTIDDFDYVNDLSLGNSKQAAVSSSILKNALQSFFGRANYNLSDKYLLTATMRADGSTKFGSNNKYGYFPSASAAWRMNEEQFIKDIDLFSNLKLRAGWGITGNQEIPNKISQMLLGSSGGAILDGSSKNVIQGVTLTRTPNPDIKWEKTDQLNLGLDFGFLQGRLNGTIDLFDKTTKDVLLEVFSVSPAPTTRVWTNVEDMRINNKGIEISLNGVILEKKDLTWDLGFNFTTIKNRVSGLPISQITTGSPSGPGITGHSSQIIKNGYAIGTFWGRKFLGFDEQGNSLFEKDENGIELQQTLGSALPRFSYGINTSLAYKSFDLNVAFNGVYGNKVYNNVANIINQNTLIAKEWNASNSAIETDENPNGTLTYSSRFIENGSYLRLSNATLGYNLKLRDVDWINSVRFNLSANNLFTITKYSGYDPEVNADHSSGGVPSIGIDWTTYPKARTILFGVNVEF